jgi:hypothetical protein
MKKRPDRVKVMAWVRKLSESQCVGRVPLLKNRNKHAALMLRSLEELGHLEGIFKMLPGTGAEREIGTLQRHQELEIELAVKAVQSHRKTIA